MSTQPADGVIPAEQDASMDASDVRQAELDVSMDMHDVMQQYDVVDEWNDDGDGTE